MFSYIHLSVVASIGLLADTTLASTVSHDLVLTRSRLSLLSKPSFSGHRMRGVGASMRVTTFVLRSVYKNAYF